MNKFSKSVAKILDYNRLAEHISNTMIRNNMIVDLGSGDCSLIKALMSNYNIRSIGIDSDEEKVEICKKHGITVLAGDIRIFSPTGNMAVNNLTLHAGFCLFNTFPLGEIHNIVKHYFSISNIDELFFEIQNNTYFKNKYTPRSKNRKTLNDVVITSWNEPFNDKYGSGVDLIMEYGTQDDRLINRTIDRLYSHEISEIVSGLQNLASIELNTYSWPIRFEAEDDWSHHYIHIRKS
ncbi:MAG: class I SAM-dependent methyltransferase [Pseudomonadota bacterium]|nr:class I SAM-dependent methyltransferase [Pseudomonadota bacterium]